MQPVRRTWREHPEGGYSSKGGYRVVLHGQGWWLIRGRRVRGPFHGMQAAMEAPPPQEPRGREA